MDVADPGRAPMMSASRFKDGNTNGSGLSWFTLWTANTAVDLWSSGGNLTPFTFSTATDLAVVYPSILRAVAASGSLYYGKSLATVLTQAIKAAIAQPCCSLPASTVSCNSWPATPSTVATCRSVAPGAASTALATPLRPAFVGIVDGFIIKASNLSADGDLGSP